MKITHIALNSRVTDNLTYQDNLLPKYHKLLGFDVSMITSRYIWSKSGTITTDNRSSYINEHGVKMIRLRNKFSTTNNSKFKRFHNLFETIENEEPDILFIHGVQFLDIKSIIKYAKKILK